MKTIYFYSKKGKYGFLSNFYHAPIEIDGFVYPTAEHYFQAMKFAGKLYAEEIRLSKSPMDAVRLGRSRIVKLRDNWESVKEEVMMEALAAKFTQHEDLHEKLLNTGDARLVEHTANDSYWGDGGDGSGNNRLGVLLAYIRDYIRKDIHECDDQS